MSPALPQAKNASAISAAFVERIATRSVFRSASSPPSPHASRLTRSWSAANVSRRSLGTSTIASPPGRRQTFRAVMSPMFVYTLGGDDTAGEPRPPRPRLPNGCYPRGNVRRAGALVKPDLSVARSVTV